MEIKIEEIKINEKMKAEIDALDSGKIYIVQEGRVIKLPLPEYGVLELPCQNYKTRTPAYRITTKL